MIEVCTIGDTLIRVGDRDIRPNAPVAFAALLYLCFERGRRVPRPHLQELLFPEADDGNAAHSLRQLLYKLRRLGVKLETHGNSFLLPASDVVLDIDLLERNDDGMMERAALAGQFLPGYQPGASTTFRKWLDGVTAVSHRRLRSALVRCYARAKSEGTYGRALLLAESLVALDPFNATGARLSAEALALGGKREDAIATIDAFLREADDQDDLPALRQLRERLIHPEQHALSSRSQLIGRSEELAWLLEVVSKSSQGTPVMVLIWGDSGIGKTRLVEELTLQLSFGPSQAIAVITRHAQDAERPMAGLHDIVPRLLEVPGALGTTPQSMALLRHFSGDALGLRPSEATTIQASQLSHALGDLIESICSEAPLFIVIDNAQWLDGDSRDVLLQADTLRSSNVQLILTHRGQPDTRLRAPSSVNMHVRRLEGLGKAFSASLLDSVLGAHKRLDEQIRQQCLSLAEGNPLFLRTIGEHLRLGGSTPSTEARIADLLVQRIRVLEAQSLLLLRTIAALGSLATEARSIECAGLVEADSLLALQDLADRGMIFQKEHALQCSHDLLADVAFGQAPIPIRTAISRRAAVLLEREGMSEGQAHLLWHSAEHWKMVGDNAASARVFLACGDAASADGNPRLAIAAYERALPGTEEHQRPAVVTAALRTAESMLDNATVFRLVATHRPSQSGRATHHDHFANFVEICALRRQGENTWRFRERLQAIALDPSATNSIRLGASRLFLASAEQELELRAGRDFYMELQKEASLADSSADWLRLLLVYHMSLGDITAAPAFVRQFRECTSAFTAPDRVLTLGDCGLVLVRAGAVEEGLAVLAEAEYVAHDVGLQSLIVHMAVMSATVKHFLGDYVGFETSFELAERALYGSDSMPASHIANRLDMALLHNDAEGASRLLNDLLRQPVARIPYHQRIILAYQAIIACRFGPEAYSGPTWDTLDRFDRLGREACDHDLLALAVCTVARSQLSDEIAKERVREYLLVRRERFPLPPHLKHAFDGLVTKTD